MNRSYRIGYSFQRRVKKYLEKLNWNCIIHPRSAFPDIVAWKRKGFTNSYSLIMIECKVNKYLTKEEKEKAFDLLSNGKCGKFYVAYRTRKKLKFYEFGLDAYINLNYKEVKINGKNITN